MTANHHDRIKRAFRKQAPRFDTPGFTLSDREHLQWVVDQLDLQPHWTVLDVAAGTGHLGRAIAPHVNRVIASDATPEMLVAGSQRAEQEGSGNIVFEQGMAEDLPYHSDTFDLVVSRFAIHHFEDADPPMREMVRVCRPGGAVVAVDLIASEDSTVAESYNRLERMRDPSHTRALSAAEMRRLLEDVGLDVTHTACREIEVDADRWFALAETPPEARRTIVEEMTRELQGIRMTGMRPFVRDDRLLFRQTWLVAAGRKGGVKWR